jgi:hypothetical protein
MASFGDVADSSELFRSILFVTHLFDLAHRLCLGGGESALFLRAERQPGGQRTFRVTEGEPLPTSHGADVYQRIFGADLGLAPDG